MGGPTRFRRGPGRTRRPAPDPLGGARHRGRRPGLLLGPPLRRRRRGTRRHEAGRGPRLVDGVAAGHHRGRRRPGAGHPGLRPSRRSRTPPPPGRPGRPAAFAHPAARRAPAPRRRDRRRVRRHHRRGPHPQRTAARPGSAAGPRRARQVGARGGRHAPARDGAARVDPPVGADRGRGLGPLRPRPVHLQPGLRRAVRLARRPAGPGLRVRPVRAGLLVAAQAVDHRDAGALPGPGRRRRPVRAPSHAGPAGSPRSARTAPAATVPAVAGVWGRGVRR